MSDKQTKCKWRVSITHELGKEVEVRDVWDDKAVIAILEAEMRKKPTPYAIIVNRLKNDR